MKAANAIFLRLLALSGVVLSLMSLTTGCSSLELPATRQSRYQLENQMSRELAVMRQEHSRSLASLAELRADVALLQENQRRLTAQLEEVGSGQTLQFEQLKAQVQNQQANLESWRRQLTQLERALSQEGEQRAQAIKKVIETVSSEISTAYENAQANTKSGGEYTVVRGDTLSAIAKAFGVTIESIKKTNNLESDVIRTGQTLIIPGQ